MARGLDLPRCVWCPGGVDVPDRWKATLADAGAVHALLFSKEDAAERFARLRPDLLDVWERELDRERIQVRALEDGWKAFTDRAFAGAARFEELYARLDLAREPAALPVTLLGPLGREQDERSHTRMLGALLDPGVAGELGAKLLRAFLGVVEGGEAGDAWTDAEIRRARVEIEPGWRVEGKDRVVYPDLVLFVPRAEAEQVIVVENKINARDHEGQLESYRAYAERHFDTPVLVYLTPGAHSPDDKEEAEVWASRGYWPVVQAFRRVLVQERDGGAWVEVLRLYLAAILQGVLHVRLHLNPGRAVQATLIPYLEAAQET